jgi:hypothetical protein
LVVLYVGGNLILRLDNHRTRNVGWLQESRLSFQGCWVDKTPLALGNIG